MAVDVIDLPIGVGNASDNLPDDIPRTSLRPWSWPSTHRLLRRFSPDVLVLGNDDVYFNRLLIDAARGLNVPSAVVQEGATWHTSVEVITRSLWAALAKPDRSLFHVTSHLANRDLRGLLRRTSAVLTNRPLRIPGYGFGGADLLCVANPRVAESFLGSGCTSRVVATGIPDLVAELPLADSDPPLDVVYVAAPLPGAGLCPESTYREYVHALVSRIHAALPSVRFAIKIHPNGEDESTYEWLLPDFPEIEILTGSERGATIARGRAFIGFGSTLTLDAWFAGRIGLCIVDSVVVEELLTSDVYRLAFEHGATISLAEPLDELRGKLERPQEALARAVRDDYTLSVGTVAADRIASAIIGLAETRGGGRTSPAALPVVGA